MSTWAVSCIVLSLICHGCFVGAIFAMMRTEERKRYKVAKQKA
ncbi:hypothetical protein FACS1894167_15820 [Synergistales bacterium]|nr:hypothetical protein FACS1894167_15820 [Synergistales bacterium]